jgi:hypothetical protein
MWGMFACAKAAQQQRCMLCAIDLAKEDSTVRVLAIFCCRGYLRLAAYGVDAMRLQG